MAEPVLRSEQEVLARFHELRQSVSTLFAKLNDIETGACKSPCLRPMPTTCLAAGSVGMRLSAGFLAERCAAVVHVSMPYQPARTASWCGESAYCGATTGVCAPKQLDFAAAVEAAEHDLVLKQLEPMDKSRRCYRMIGDVLVERTVAETLPAGRGGAVVCM